jgi:hypothetical protein
MSSRPLRRGVAGLALLTPLLPVAAVAADADGDDRPCVTAAEYKSIQVDAGMKLRAVKRIFDSPGQMLTGGWTAGYYDESWYWDACGQKFDNVRVTISWPDSADRSAHQVTGKGRYLPQ